MQAFTILYARLDATNATNEKVAAMRDYFAEAPAADAAWVVYLLAGRRLKRLVTHTELREWAAQSTGYPLWLIEATYAVVGDLAETIALLLDGVESGADDLAQVPLHEWIEHHILPLRGASPDVRHARVTAWWRALPTDTRFVLNKLLTGSFRVGVSRRLVVRALAAHSGLEANQIAYRLMGQWQPSADFYHHLIDPEDYGESASRPYPFFLASPLTAEAQTLGEPGQWLAEWKWDGIRAQIIRRDSQCFIWSRGEELMIGRFPELEADAQRLQDGTVLDGEILAWADGAPLAFSVLQRRIGRRKPDAALLREAPVAFVAYDLLEGGGQDWRGRPLQERRDQLRVLLKLIDTSQLRLSPAVPFDSWTALAQRRAQARSRNTEGLMLKRRASAYGVGRTRGDWWKWKVDPLSIDAVLLYAQPGHGRRSGLFTDYTFGVWAGDELVPIAKAYSGLTDDEIQRLDRWIRAHTIERFGPVRSVECAQVFELAFEGIQASTRHKSGIALRFPRISRWREDIGVEDADTLNEAQRLLQTHGS